MRAVIQRVSSASVRVSDAVVGSIGSGLLVLAGFTHDDGEGDVSWVADKILGLRVFGDADGKMNLSVAEAGGALLVVSQFTLYGDARKGRRPSFVDAARPDFAIPLYEQLVSQLRDSGIVVETGSFGAHMEVTLVNDGPVTLILERHANPD